MMTGISREQKLSYIASKPNILDYSGKQSYPSTEPIVLPKLKCMIQPRLEIGAVNDPLEREADAIAEQIMRMPEPSFLPPPAGETGAQGKRILILTKATATPTSTQASPQLESNLNSLNSSSSPLDASTRSFFEPRFGEDFSQVRLHTDANAAQIAESLNAKAFTFGNNIAFGSNQYSTNTLTGRSLLGHELAHVVQQRSQGNGVIRGKWVQGKEDELMCTSEQQKLDRCEVPNTFENEARKGVECDWNKAFYLLNGLSMYEMLRVLNALPPTIFKTLQEKAPDYSSKYNIPRIIWACNIVAMHEINSLPSDFEETCQEIDRNMTYQKVTDFTALEETCQVTMSFVGPMIPDFGRSPTSKIIYWKEHEVLVYFFPGTSGETFLILGGVHQSEENGKNLTNELFMAIAEKGIKPYYNIVIIPDLFGKRIPKPNSRFINNVDTNRNFPNPGESLAKSAKGGNPKDSIGNEILPENIILIALVEKLRPKASLSIHSDSQAERRGIFVDPNVKTDADKLENKNTDADELVKKVALAAAKKDKKNKPSIKGNKVEDNIVKNTRYPGQNEVKGTSFGMWGSNEGGMDQYLIETDIEKKDNYSGWVSVIMEVLLGFPP